MLCALLIIYNLLFPLYALIASAVSLVKHGRTHRFSEKLGFYPKTVTPADIPAGSKRIWIHGVSIGEVQVALTIMKEMKLRNPSAVFIVSVSTCTGRKVAEAAFAGIAGPGDRLVFFPYDFPFAVRSALSRLKPDAIIIVETEIWPNFILGAIRRKIPFFFANARISDKSLRWYRFFNPVFKKIFPSVERIFAQSELDAARFVEIGASGEQISVSSSLKYTIPQRDDDKEKDLRHWVGPGPVLLGCSIWPSEETALLKAFRELLTRFPETKLVLVPRHTEAIPAMEDSIRSFGFESALRSQGNPEGRNVLICNTFGEMTSLMAISTVVFVGKSLCHHGGQNMIEPCALGKPVVVGPYTENFRRVMSDLLSDNAIVQVEEGGTDTMEKGVSDAIVRFFFDPGTAASFGRRAEKAVSSRVGSAGKCAEEILERICR